ncbi:MAG: hypothetical protein KR126chlam2_00473 [Chlamydiae bacterium]|nr:hypothetical protein [Chlamydiota bacterium]
MRLLLFLLFISTPLMGATPKSLSFNSTQGLFNVGPTQYVTDDAGNTLAVWSVNNGRNIILQAAYKPIGSDWQVSGSPLDPSQSVSYFYGSVIDWTVEMDREGNVVVIWRIFNGSKIVVQVNYRAIGGSFSTAGDPRFQANFLNDYRYSITSLPQVGIGNGNAVILWFVNNGWNNVLQASTKSAATGFSQPGDPTLPSNVLNFLTYQTGRFNITTTPLFFVDKDGNAIVTWQLNNRVIGPQVQVVQAVTKFVGASFEIAGDPQRQENILSPVNFSISSLEESTIGSGNATVFWKRVDQTTRNLILQAAFKPINGVWEKPPLN